MNLLLFSLLLCFNESATEHKPGEGLYEGPPHVWVYTVCQEHSDATLWTWDGGIHCNRRLIYFSRICLFLPPGHTAPFIVGWREMVSVDGLPAGVGLQSDRCFLLSCLGQWMKDVGTLKRFFPCLLYIIVVIQYYGDNINVENANIWPGSFHAP